MSSKRKYSTRTLKSSLSIKMANMIRWKSQINLIRFTICHKARVEMVSLSKYRRKHTRIRRALLSLMQANWFCRAWCPLASLRSSIVRVQQLKPLMCHISRKAPQLALHATLLLLARRTKSIIMTTLWARKTFYPRSGICPISSIDWTTLTWLSSKKTMERCQKRVTSKRYLLSILSSKENVRALKHTKIKYVRILTNHWMKLRLRPKIRRSRIHPLVCQTTWRSNKFWRAFTSKTALSSWLTRKCSIIWCKPCKNTIVTHKIKAWPKRNDGWNKIRAKWIWCKIHYPNCEQKHFTSYHAFSK